MFKVGDLVYHKEAETFGLGVIVEKADRTAGPTKPKVYAYKTQFAVSLKSKYPFNRGARWFLEQDLGLASEAYNEQRKQ